MKQINPAVRLLAVFTLILGFLYPLAITGIAQTIFKRQADGSLMEKNGRVMGSELIAQPFTHEQYVFPRPSAVNYNAANSGGSNQGPLNPAFQEALQKRIAGLGVKTIASDLVTASASGLDPHLSLASVMIQVPRVAKARGLDEASVRGVVNRQIERYPFSDPVINVLKLNLALDNMQAPGSP